MTASDGPPPDHRVGRQDRLLLFLRIATGIAVVGAALGVLVPGSAGRAGADAVVATLVAVPLLRILWLIQRWARKGDRRFVAIACVLLVIVGVAALVG